MKHQVTERAGGTFSRRPRFGPKPLPARFCNFDRLLKMMEVRGLDGIVSSYAPNVFYLSGFGGNPSLDEMHGMGIVVISRHRPEEPVMAVVDQFACLFLSQPTWIQDIRPFAVSRRVDFDPARGGTPMDPYIPLRGRDVDWVKRANKIETNRIIAVKGAMKDLGLDKGRVGFDNLRFAATVAGPEVEVVDAYGPMKYVRQVKTEPEIERIRTATQVNRAAIEQTVAGWQKGMTWHELNHLYHVSAVDLGGALHDSFALVCMNDERTDPTVAMVIQTGLEDDYVIQPGTSIMFDCHGTWSRYCWDGGKTWLVGDEPNSDARAIAKAAGNGTLEILANMKPGVRISDLQVKARQAMKKSGLARPEDVLVYFHGLGLEHNDQEIAPGSEYEFAERFDWPLEKGMVVALHMAIPGDPQHRYFIEDIALVTDSGGDAFFGWGVEPLLNGK